MSHEITQHINEDLRDAMLAYYINTVLPNDATVQVPARKDGLTTADDVYRYLLLDPQVSQAVPTTRIASAITSLQHYINSIYMGVEPGYEQQRMSDTQQAEWRDSLMTYSLWRATQQLRHYPANYLSPTLRHDKSDSFKQLESELNQFRIEPASLLAAVHSYLNRFEELATIKTLNGYIDGDKDRLAESVYYFVGKSSAENTYYWRTLDMTKSPAANGALDVPDSKAWTGWQKIHLSFDETVPDHTIRPVVFNGRLFVVWAQCINPTPASRGLTPFPARSDAESNNEFLQRLERFMKSSYVQFRLYFSYRRLDDSWSTPQACIQEYNVMRAVDDLSTEHLMKATTSIAVLDSTTTPVSLFLSIGVKPNNHQASQQDDSSRYFFQAVRLDQYLQKTTLEMLGSPETIFPWLKNSELALRYLALFSHHNKSNFQFRAPNTKEGSIDSLQNDTPHSNTSGWNFERNQEKIRGLAAKKAITLDLSTSVLTVKSGLAQGFQPHRTITFKSVEQPIALTITLSVSSPELPSDPLALDPTSMLQLEGAEFEDWTTSNFNLSLICNQTGVEHAGFIQDKEGVAAKLALPTPESGNGKPSSVTLNLQEKYVAREAFEYFFNTPDVHYTVTLSFHGNPQSEHGGMHHLSMSAAHIFQKQRLYKPVLMYPKKPSMPLPTTPHRNNTILVGLSDESRRNLSGALPELPVDKDFAMQIELHPWTLRPYGEDVIETPMTPEESRLPLTLIYGVLVLESDVNYPDPIILGYALKTATFTLDPATLTTVVTQAPGIRHYTANDYGTAEFIDFTGSAIAKVEKTEFDRASIRTNTCIAGLLTKTASADLKALFSLPIDAWKEPPMKSGGAPTALDFQGAHGIYFWELFLYLPWLLAYRLSLEQQYAEAEVWIRYLFDPTSNPVSGASKNAYWRLPALRPAVLKTDVTSTASKDTALPIRQALYLFYIDTLLNRGDAAYRQMTRDSLAEAKLWYVRAKGLLGPRPSANPVAPWISTTLEQLVAGTSTLCSSLNPDLLGRWDKVEARLYNLRHYLDLTGKPLSLPLYTSTLSPQSLLAAYQQDGSLRSARPPLPAVHTGHYRFQVILGYALQAVDNLIQLGTAVLSLIERKEHAQYLETQQQHAWELARIGVEQQVQAIELDVRNKDALLAGRRIIQDRLAFFENLLKAGITPAEALASEKYQESVHWEVAAGVAQVNAGMAMMIPNIFGTSSGGMRFEGGFHALSATSQTIANKKRANAANLDRSEQFARRAAEWAHALEQSRLELAQADAQLHAFSQQEDNARLQLRLAQTSLAHTRTLYDILGKRFTNAQLYQWLNGQLSTFYYQGYDAALSLCLAAEACWQEERAQWDRTFIQTHLWTQQYRGLTAGEGLKQNLLTMSNAYITQNERPLEITKTVSLRQLHDKDPLATRGIPWAELKEKLEKDGTLSFDLTQKLFDDDYPNHYLRRIKNVSVSLPATLGPYEDIRALLTQTANTTQLAPPSRTQRKGSDEPHTPIKKDLRARQEIALSSGLNDSGLFTLNFDNDERYLPFEYTGAVSSWQLTFPNHSKQQELLKSLTDIIVHVRYTAKSSGGQR